MNCINSDLDEYEYTVRYSGLYNQFTLKPVIGRFRSPFLGRSSFG